MEPKPQTIRLKIALTLVLFLTVYSGVRAQKQDCSVVLNHFYITVDSATYQAILSSEILNSDFAFSYEKIRSWGGGIYLIGEDNYIEIFHPNSIVNEYLPVGFTWICQASLVPNCIGNYNLPSNESMKQSSDENFNELSVSTLDSVYIQNASSLFTTIEMNTDFYESWTKKPFHDSLNFLTTDYNSPAESDSSKNYLFSNVTGLEINLNAQDSSSIIQYLYLIGYSLESKDAKSMRFTNSIDFIELHFSENIELATIAVIHFKLNQPTESKQISIGSSEMFIENNTGRWEINKQYSSDQ